MKIALSAVVAFMLIGCSGDSKNETHTQEVEKKVEKHEVVKAVESIKQEAIKAVEPAKQEVKKVLEPIKEEVIKVVEPAEKKVQEVVEKATPDGATLFKVCSSCHGSSAEKSALGKSQIIKGWDASKVIGAINGYKDGTYGGAMKGLMKSQVSKLSDSEIKAVAEHISKL